LTLTNGQAAFQAGINTNGMVVGWDDIAPAPDGTFTVVNQSYNGPTDVAAVPKGVWLVNHRASSVSRVDPDTGRSRVVARPVGTAPSGSPSGSAVCG
jgi:streptogramin lyase